MDKYKEKEKGTDMLVDNRHILNEIRNFITSSQTEYRKSIEITPSWTWNMYEEIINIINLINSKYTKNSAKNIPFKQIILDKLNLNIRATSIRPEDLDVYAVNSGNHHKNLLYRKANEKWVLESGFWDFLREMNEQYHTFGGVLVKKLNGAKIEVVPMQKLSFVDQHDILSGAICEVHNYSVSQLLAMRGIWNTEVINELIENSTNSRASNTVSNFMKETSISNYITIYELTGDFPKNWITNNPEDKEEYTSQMHVVAEIDGINEKTHLNLFKTEKKSPYKFLKRGGKNSIYQRALGRGTVEELKEPQKWINHYERQMLDILNQASAMIYYSPDQTFVSSNQNMANLPKGAVLQADAVNQLPMGNLDISKFMAKSQEFEQRSKEISGAYEAITGEGSGSIPFASQALLNREANALHKTRQEELDDFIVEIYRDWIIPEFKKIIPTDEFLANFTSEEIIEIQENLLKNMTNEKIKELILQGVLLEEEDIQNIQQQLLSIIKEKTPKFIKILKEDLNDIKLDVRVHRNKNSMDKVLLSERLSNIFTMVANNPAILQNKGLNSLFKDIIEASGLSSMKYDFTPSEAQLQASPLPKKE